MQGASGRNADCAAVQEDAHDYVMGTLDPDTHEAIAEHCERCPNCRAMIDELSSTVTMLAFASRAVTPPPTAKAALFARIAQNAVPAESATTWGASSLESFRTPSLPASPVIPASPLASVQPEATSPSNTWSRFVSYAAPLATIPLILALGFVGYWGVSARMELNDRTQTVDELNSSVQLLNSKVSALSVGMEDFEQYLNPNTSKHYAMLDPSPSSGGSQAYGLLLTNVQGGEAVVMTWRLDPKVQVYEIVLELVDGRITSVGDLFTDADGDAMRRVELGVSVAEVESIHIRPKSTDFSTDSDLNNHQPDALYAAIWPGLNGMQDTIPLQSYP